jgi:acetyl-CoA decarbonylase/synthase complex subunit gamma
MALKALDIYKFLPKSNCAKCGSPTCLAFAMQLAAKKASLDQCPEATPEARAALEGASAPPIRLVTIGAGDRSVKIGNETVLFRHDETFYHPTGVAIRVRDDLDEKALAERVAAIAKLQFERVGQKLPVDMIAVENVSGDSSRFAKAAAAAAQPGLALILMSKDPCAVSAALPACDGFKPLIYRADESNWEPMARVAQGAGCPLAVAAAEPERAAELTPKICGAGVADLVLDVTGGGMAATLQALTKVRRLALRKGARALGYPCMVVARHGDPQLALAEAATAIAKYAGVVVIDTVAPAEVLPLLTIRQNLYTDPRKPVQVEPKLYTVGAATPTSPLLVTTNFSLTYYTVESDVEASRVPSFIGVIDTEGTSVLTAWASEKLTTAKIAAFLKSDAVKSRVSHHKVIIPGYVAVMSGKLEEDSGWQVQVGPRESSGIPKYLKTMWKAD